MEPAAADKAVAKRSWRRFFRYSLRTLVIFSLLCGSIGAVWYCREAWVAGALPYLSGNPKILFSPDGSRFTATISTEENRESTCTIFLCDGRTGAVVKQLSSQKNSGQEPVFTQNGKWILTEPHWWTTEYPGMRLFDAQSGREFMDGTLRPGSFKFCEDESKVFLTHSKVIEVRDGRNGELLTKFEPGGEYCASRDGSLIALSREKMVRICDATKGRVISTLENEYSARRHGVWFGHSERNPTFSPDKRWFFVKGVRPRIEIPPDYPILWEQPVLLKVSDEDDLCVRVYDTTTGKMIQEIDGTLPEESWTPDGKYLLTQFFWETQVRSSEPPFAVRHVLDGRMFRKGKYSGDSTKVATYVNEWMKREKRTRIESLGGPSITPTYPYSVWDVATGRKLVTLENATPSIDDKYWYGNLYVPGNTIWDSRSGRRIDFVPPNQELYMTLPPTRSWCVLSENGKFYVRNEEKKQAELFDDRGSMNETVPAEVVLAISPDGQRIIANVKDKDPRMLARRRGPGVAGFLSLPQVWLSGVMVILLLWSVYRDLRESYRTK